MWDNARVGGGVSKAEYTSFTNNIRIMEKTT